MFAAAQNNLPHIYKESAMSYTDINQPAQILQAALFAFAPEGEQASLFTRIAPFFKRMRVEAGTVLWALDDLPNSFYVIESGVLRASRNMRDLDYCFVETMLPAT